MIEEPEQTFPLADLVTDLFDIVLRQGVAHFPCGVGKGSVQPRRSFLEQDQLQVVLKMMLYICTV